MEPLLLQLKAQRDVQLPAGGARRRYLTWAIPALHESQEYRTGCCLWAVPGDQLHREPSSKRAPGKGHTDCTTPCVDTVQTQESILLVKLEGFGLVNGCSERSYLAQQ